MRLPGMAASSAAGTGGGGGEAGGRVEPGGAEVRPASGRDGHPGRPSPGWLAARVGGGRESVVWEEGTEEPSPK